MQNNGTKFMVQSLKSKCNPENKAEAVKLSEAEIRIQLSIYQSSQTQ
jgi:hypothetical protein